ncbi:YppG family protein [Virgibacillus kimchii]
MFPVRQRPPMPPRSPFGPPGPPPRMPQPPRAQQPNQTRQNLMAMLQDENGQWDFDKISNAAGHVSKIYGQVSPLITRFFR